MDTWMLFMMGLLSTRVCADFADTQDEGILIDEDVYRRGLFHLARTDDVDDDDIGFDEEFDGERRAMDHLDDENRATNDLDNEKRAKNDIDNEKRAKNDLDDEKRAKNDLDDEKRAMDERKFTTARFTCNTSIARRLPRTCKKCTKAKLRKGAINLCRFKLRFKPRVGPRVKRQTAGDWPYWSWFCGYECK